MTGVWLPTLAHRNTSLLMDETVSRQKTQRALRFALHRDVSHFTAAGPPEREPPLNTVGYSFRALTSK